MIYILSRDGYKAITRGNGKQSLAMVTNVEPVASVRLHGDGKNDTKKSKESPPLHLVNRV